jgi:Mrp family chromosome partitioning ATPase
LYVLPAGRSASAVSAGHLSVKAIKRVLEEARQHFDVVIVDSGPILGSIEAATVAQEVDGTVFVISRGQDQSAVQNALRRLHSLRVKVEGLVFNRAKDADLLQSSFGSSWRGSMRSVSHPLRLMGDLSPTMADLS